MQVNLHGSLCKLLPYFIYCYGHRKKTKFSAVSTKIYTILTLRSKKFSGEGADSSSCGERDTPSPHPTSLAPSAPRFGSRLRRSILPPNFNSWIRLCALQSYGRRKRQEETEEQCFKSGIRGRLYSALGHGGRDPLIIRSPTHFASLTNLITKILLSFRRSVFQNLTFK